MNNFAATAFGLMVLSGLMNSCATSFRGFSPEAPVYRHQIDGKLDISYSPVALKGQYAKRQHRSMCSLVHITLFNQTPHPITIAKDVKVFSADGNEVRMMSTDDFYEATYQNPKRAMAFLSLVPANFYRFDEETSGGKVTDRKFVIIPFGLIVGPALAFGNRAAAKSANRKYSKALQENNIANQTIAPGQRIEGVLGLFAPHIGQELSFTLINQE